MYGLIPTMTFAEIFKVTQGQEVRNFNGKDVSTLMGIHCLHDCLHDIAKITGWIDLKFSVCKLDCDLGSDNWWSPM